MQRSLAAFPPPCYDDDEASAARRRRRMPKILVVTSNPLMAFGGHLVIAEALVDALKGRLTRLKRLEQLDGLPRGGRADVR